MVSPSVEVNSASLGAWTSAVGGVAVARGEVVSVRLADSAGVRYWSLAITSTDELTIAPTVTAAGSVSGTATFTMPTTPTDGIALIFTSIVGVANFGLDANYAARASYTATFKLYDPSPTGIPVQAVDETLEGNTAFGWVVPFNTLIRSPPGSGGPPTGSAGGDLGSTYPNPSVLKVRGAAIGTAAGSLTTGAVLRVTGASTADWGAVNLASGAAVTGNLPVGNFAPGSNEQVLATAAGATVWTAAPTVGTSVTTPILSGKATGNLEVNAGASGSTVSIKAGTSTIAVLDNISAGSPVITLGPAASQMFLKSTNASLFAVQSTAGTLLLDGVGKAQIRVGASSLDGTVSLTAGPNGIRLANDSIAPTEKLEVKGNIAFDETTTAPKFFVVTRTGNNPTKSLTILGQKPSGTAVGATNNSSGDVLIQTGINGPGGTAGVIALEPGEGSRVLAAVDYGSDQRLRLFADLIHFRAGTGAPPNATAITPNIPGGSLYFKNSSGTEDLFYYVNGLPVSLLTGGTGLIPASNITPGTNGQVLATVAGATAWSTPGGDVTGAPSASTVGKVKGTTITTAGGALTTGYTLKVTGVATADWGLLDGTASVSPGGADKVFVTNAGNTATAWSTIGGDVTGPVTAFVVGKVKGTTVTTAGGSLTTGQPLRVTASGTCDWGPLDLSNPNATTGSLPATGVAIGDTFEDLTSVIEGRFSSPLWKANTPSQAPTVHAHAGTLAIADASVPANADLINIGANAPTNGVFERIFGTPASGTGNFEINIPMSKPTGDGTTTIYVEIRTYGPNVLVSSGTFTLTTTYATKTIASFALSASTDYIVRWYCNSTGLGTTSQARAFVGPLQLKALSPTAPAFPDVAFYRVPVTPDMFHDGAQQKPPLFEVRTYSRNSHTRVILRTNAPYVYAQAYAKLGSGVQNGIGVKVNGVAQSPIVPASGGAQTDYKKITLSTSGMQTVEFTTSMATDAGLTGNASGWYLNFLDAILVPTGYFAEVIYPATPKNRIVFYGDSIPSGYGPTNPPLDGFPQHIRRGFHGSSVFECASSAALFRDTKSPGAFPATDVQVSNLVNRLAKHFGGGSSGILYITIGVNDWVGTASGTMSAANFEILAGQVLDGFHLQCPNVQVVWQSPLATSTQANTNTFGDALAAYRTAISNACAVASRAKWATYVDGTSIISAGTDTTDGTHPNDLGTPKWAGATLSTIATLQADTTTPLPNGWDIVTPGYLEVNRNYTAKCSVGGWTSAATTFGALYLAAARTSANLYSLLGDATNTYINAPSASGKIYHLLANGANPEMTMSNSGLSIGRGTTVSLARIDVMAKATSDIVSIFRGFASQTAALVEVRKSDETVLGSWNKDGFITVSANNASTSFLGGWTSAPTTFGALYLARASTSAAEYTFLGDGTNTFLNSPSASGRIYFNTSNSTKGAFKNGLFRLGDGTDPTDTLELVGSSAKLAFDKAVASPRIYQQDPTADHGQILRVQAQNGVGTDKSGGSLFLISGTKTGTGVDGSVSLITGSTTRFSVSPSGSGTAAFTVTALTIDAAIASPTWTHTVAASGSGTAWQIQAQSAQASGNTSGGDLVLTGGLGNGSGVGGVINGRVILKSGSTEILHAGTDAGVRVFSTSLKFGPSVSAPLISQEDASSNHGQTMGIVAQAGNGSDKNGGPMVIRGGARTGSGVQGSTYVGTGNADYPFQAVDINGCKAVLASKAVVTSSDLVSNTGDGVVFIADGSTTPSAKTTTGCTIYSTNGAFSVTNGANANSGVTETIVFTNAVVNGASAGANGAAPATVDAYLVIAAPGLGKTYKIPLYAP